MPRIFDLSNILKARQIRAARALLDWSQEDLAAASSLSVATVRKLELGHISPRGKTTNLLRAAFEGAGLEFLEPDGVRHRPDDIVVYQGRDGAKSFFDDVYYTAKKKGCEVVLAYPSVKKYFANILEDYRWVHVERMTVLKDRVSVKCIISEDKDNLDASAYAEYRWISRNYVDAAPFYVYDNKYAIFILEADPPPKIIVIQSHVVAEAFRHQFYSMWEKATPLNEVVRDKPLAERPLPRNLR